MIKRAIEIAGDQPYLLDTHLGYTEDEPNPTPQSCDLEDAIIAGPNAETYFHMARAYAMGGRSPSRRRPAPGDGGGPDGDALHPLEREQSTAQGELAPK